MPGGQMVSWRQRLLVCCRWRLWVPLLSLLSLPKALTVGPISTSCWGPCAVVLWLRQSIPVSPGWPEAQVIPFLGRHLEADGNSIYLAVGVAEFLTAPCQMWPWESLWFSTYLAVNSGLKRELSEMLTWENALWTLKYSTNIRHYYS